MPDEPDYERLLREDQSPPRDFTGATRDLVAHAWKTRRSRRAFHFSPMDWVWLIGAVVAWWIFETWLDTFPYPWPNIFGFGLIVLWVAHFASRFYRWYKS